MSKAYNNPKDYIVIHGGVVKNINMVVRRKLLPVLGKSVIALSRDTMTICVMLGGKRWINC